MEPHTHIGKRRKPMSLFFHGYHGERYCSLPRTHNDDGDGHTPKKRLTETCNLGLPFLL